MEDIKVGDYVFYLADNASTGELGRVTQVCDDGCFTCYHSGGTAAKTHWKNIYPILNQCHIIQDGFKTDLGVLDNRFGDLDE